MTFARRALVLALAMLMLCAAASAQTLRDELDPRNIAPTVGTGGPVGGPTGLFTIYDGQTLRRGEFTFSFAYSNFDRDPGNVDITDMPVSFQIGLNDYLELFFNTDAFRQIKVNNVRNLSGFYMPNSLGRVFPANVLSPVPASTGLSIPAGIVVFRPPNSQPFVQFPFVGGAAPDFSPGVINPFPLPGTLGAGSTASASTFGAADSFPGLGSGVGSILPGIVLTTTTVTAPGGGQIITGATQTVAPSYLPDAPLLNRTYGESSFNNFVVGAKFRLTEVDNALGVALVPFYRFWLDRSGDGDFNQLQRGSGGGGDIGDFGLVFAVDGRLSRSVNLSANVGYILNSNPKADFPAGPGSPAGERTLIDRPDELITGVGFDFPVNQFFQPIAELRATHYVGGRTPNAFENSPIEGLLGIRVYPRRFFGFSAWYRRHLNQQNDDQLPAGFTRSDDPNGFGGQFFIGHRNERVPAVLPNNPPVVSLAASTSRVVLPAECGPNQRPAANCTPTEGGGGAQVQLTTTATDPDGDTLLYTYSTTGGRIVGEGPNVTLDLTGVQPGTYTASVEVNDGCGCISYTSTTVTVERCPCEEVPCPTVNVTCASNVDEGQPITFTANVSQGDPSVTPNFNWTVSAGTIESGQGTSTITVSTTGLGNTNVTATVEVTGYPNCPPVTSPCTTQVGAVRTPTKIDEYGDLALDDEKARLDNLAIELQNAPQSNAAIIVYGGRRSSVGLAQRRADRARDYLVNQRGIDPGRITTVDGGFREDLTTELWIVPSGASQPQASPTVDASEVTPAPERRPRRPRRGRRR